MKRFLLCCLLLVLASPLAGAPASAQYTSTKPDSGLDEMKYRAIYGHAPPPTTDQQTTTGPGAGGETTTTEVPKPRYRFSNDPLLNPPGSRAPGPGAPAPPGSQSTTPPSAYPQAPAQAYGLGLPSTKLPMRQIRVRVVDDQGEPVPMARVSLSTRQQPFFREGLTDQQGNFTASVPCYVPGGGSMLSHSLRVSNTWGSTERLLMTRQGACATVDLVSVTLADPNRLNRMLQRYRQRQELYEQEEEEQKAKEEAEQEALPGKGKGKGEAGSKK
ncbi:MAG: carboxypeptidase-like regulatory domain-containing protein [Deltaproteobacteria bacterium]|nr:carboxypeptidase-like regulatory domain-containing protein [Deltaproteobacteria bacterium]